MTRKIPVLSNFGTGIRMMEITFHRVRVLPNSGRFQYRQRDGSLAIAEPRQELEMDLETIIARRDCIVRLDER